jgi:hypothetical protein
MYCRQSTSINQHSTIIYTFNLTAKISKNVGDARRPEIFSSSIVTFKCECFEIRCTIRNATRRDDRIIDAHIYILINFSRLASLTATPND